MTWAAKTQSRPIIKPSYPLGKPANLALIASLFVHEHLICIPNLLKEGCVVDTKPRGPCKSVEKKKCHVTGCRL